MKWSQMPTPKKVLAVLGFVCALAYLTLESLRLLDVCQLHGAISRICFGTSWLCLGILYSGKKISILHYIVAALWFLAGALHFFF